MIEQENDQKENRPEKEKEQEN